MLLDINLTPFSIEFLFEVHVVLSSVFAAAALAHLVAEDLTMEGCPEPTDLLPELDRSVGMQLALGRGIELLLSLLLPEDDALGPDPDWCVAVQLVSFVCPLPSLSSPFLLESPGFR